MKKKFFYMKDKIKSKKRESQEKKKKLIWTKF